jgi:hypothetical protein
MQGIDSYLPTLRSITTVHNCVDADTSQNGISLSTVVEFLPCHLSRVHCHSESIVVGGGGEYPSWSMSAPVQTKMAISLLSKGENTLFGASKIVCKVGRTKYAAAKLHIIVGLGGKQTRSTM